MATYPVFGVGEVLTSDDMNAVGLWLIKTQTIGTAVSSVAVTDAFSSTYDNYLITVSGGTASAAGVLGLRLGSTTTNYWSSLIYGNWNTTLSYAATKTASSWLYAGSQRTTVLHAEVFLNGPNLAKPTAMRSTWWQNGDTGPYTGYLDNTTQYTDFTFVAEPTTTLTGGTIRVYGMRN